MYKLLMPILLAGVFLTQLVGCSSTGNPFGNTNSSVTAKKTPTVSQGNNSGYSSYQRSTEPEVNPKAIADMRVLANESTQSVYLIGPSDLIEIKVFQAEELSRETRVDQRGNITLPLMGSIRVAGLSKVGAEKRLAQLMGKNLLRNPQVSIFIKEFTAQRVTVEGEVRKQGVYPLSGQVTILQAVALAGGLTDDAAAQDVILFRRNNNGARGYNVDLIAIRNGLVADPLVKNDDRIVIKKLEEKRVTVDGEVNKAGVFPFKKSITVMQAVAMAQGLSNLADPSKVAVFRREENGEKAYSVNLEDIRSGKTPDPYVVSDDRIVVHRSNSRYWLKELSPLMTPLYYLNLIF